LRSEAVSEVMEKHPDRSRSIVYGKTLGVVVDRERVRFGTWYEMFPRSQEKVPGRSAPFAEAERRLPEIAGLGFDVVYLTPIQPIGKSHRKGQNNALVAGPDDPRSPYALGSEEGGHKAVHPALGTLEDFGRFVDACRGQGMEVALDLAIQCSPDHPYIEEHPEWFRFRPDGSIKYAENPPKKYQDIVSVDFYSEAAYHLWREWLDVVLFWVETGGQDLQGRQPPHQAVSFLGVGHRGGPRGAPGRDLPLRSLHPPEGDEGPGQTRLYPVLHLLHVVQQQAGADRVPDRAHQGLAEGVHAPQLLPQHPGHPAPHPAVRRQTGLQDAPRPRRHAVDHLRHLQWLRVVREHPARRAEHHRLLPGLRGVRVQGLGLGQARKHEGIHRARKPDQAREPGAPVPEEPLVLRGRGRQRHLLRQEDQRQCRLRRRQPPPLRRPRDARAVPAMGAWDGGGRGLRRRGALDGAGDPHHGKLVLGEARPFEQPGGDLPPQEGGVG
jgi:hypothetical protein